MAMVYEAWIWFMGHEYGLWGMNMVYEAWLWSMGHEYGLWGMNMVYEAWAWAGSRSHRPKRLTLTPALTPNR